MKVKPISTIFLAALVFSGCATDDPNRRAKAGAVIGAVAGAAIGNQSDSDSGKIVGAALGGIAGYTVGRYMDNQQKELETALADELENNLIELTRLENDVLRVNLSSEASFNVNESNLQPPFYPSLDKLSEVLSKYDQTNIKVLGHTDDTGDEGYNQALSERRSDAVAVYLRDGGVQDQRISSEGQGELAPRAPNDTADNRTRNRRVEIDLIPIVAADG